MKTLMTLPLLAVLLAGCTTTFDTTSYKLISATEATADKAMSAWAQYVVAQRGEGRDLTVQEVQVRTAYTAYRAAMNAAYDARDAYRLTPVDPVSPTTEQRWTAAINAAQAACNQLLTVVNLITNAKVKPLWN